MLVRQELFREGFAWVIVTWDVVYCDMAFVDLVLEVICSYVDVI